MTEQLMSPNLRAFLDMLAYSEGTSTIPDSDNGYRVIVGGQLFDSYDDHPRKLVAIPSLNISSTAAGRYQLLARYYDAYKAQLGLADFSPESQDAIAIQQIRERHALTDIEAGHIPSAIGKCNTIWASLPGSPYGQHTRPLASLLSEYTMAGGALS